MKISNHKPIIFLSGIFCLVLIVFLSVGTLKERSNEIIHLKSSVKAFEHNSASSNSGLIYNSVFVNSVSTGVSHEVDDEEYF